MKYLQAKQKTNNLQLLTPVFLAALLGFYIFQVHAITSNVYHISNLEATLAQHKEASKVLQLSWLRAPSFENLGALAKQYNFEKVRDISYLQLLAGPIARKSGSRE